jgi:hypothetical protein
MSVRVMSWVWEHSPAAGTDLLVLLAIADNADDSGGNAWPSIATLGRKCRISPRTVQRSIRKLELDGLLQVDEQGGRGGSNRYRLVIDTPRQSVTPVKLTPRQNDTGDTSDTPPLTPVSPEPSLNRPSTPQPPASGGRDHCSRHTRHRKACDDCVAAASALTAKPAWCGTCDERTRLRDRVCNGNGDVVVERCPNCHPTSQRSSA